MRAGSDSDSPGGMLQDLVERDVLEKNEGHESIFSVEDAASMDRIRGAERERVGGPFVGSRRDPSRDTGELQLVCYMGYMRQHPQSSSAFQRLCMSHPSK